MSINPDVLHLLLDASPLGAVFVTAVIALLVVALALSKLPRVRR